MNSRAAMKRLMLIVMIVLSVLGQQGCGKDDAYTPGYGNSILINPESIDFTAGGGAVCTGSPVVYEPVRITILNNADPPVPIANAALTVNIWAAQGGSTYTDAVKIYDADRGTNLPEVVPYTTQTTDHGTKDLILELDTSCAWFGDLEVFSGTAYETMTVTVN